MKQLTKKALLILSLIILTIIIYNKRHRPAVRISNTIDKNDIKIKICGENFVPQYIYKNGYSKSFPNLGYGCKIILIYKDSLYKITGIYISPEEENKTPSISFDFFRENDKVKCNFKCSGLMINNLEEVLVLDQSALSTSKIPECTFKEK
ncbi:hypothetical protein GVN16_19535 [Emticicia sp. CRIBPO]|uniref:hypothetical protein n=1 Tax=Emticicia sp. CRIBPO TaxID=2683258 RepID=UPI001412A2A3|nr:hypothetical protein [Emticicia sp. CRIBPO]NBA87972.1 hypothetical protein [Emticicia sp. CRIBPO]